MAEMTPEEEEALRREVAQAFPGHQGPQLFEQNDLTHIKHVIGVVSGKGGVGKSLVSGLLATELSRRGAKVGILDADITGPSIPKMFGLSHERIMADGERQLMIPVTTAGGIQVVSTNLVLDHETDPVLWRGPVLMGVLKQFWEETEWGEIDYLIVDMPPGTGDIALTVYQQVPVDGIVIVTSPQDLVQMVVAKAVNMARQMDIPVLGLIENMSYITCPDCGRKIEVFGPSKVAESAKEYDLDVLAQLPIDPALAAACDEGKIETAAPEGIVDTAVSRIVETCAVLDAAK
ncbi:MAG: Mrp/NBP35 family ATP-binding protein [Olegusella sp.]|nr:Mrp/NBP35 family ATP-binding protein [Olegusella sp.]